MPTIVWWGIIRANLEVTMRPKFSIDPARLEEVEYAAEAANAQARESTQRAIAAGDRLTAKQQEIGRRRVWRDGGGRTDHDPDETAKENGILADLVRDRDLERARQARASEESHHAMRIAANCREYAKGAR